MTPGQKPLDANGVRKRIQMFYFAAGLNLFVVIYVLAGAGASQSGGTMVFAICAICILFAWLNFYMARMWRKRWEELTRQQQGSGSAPVSE